MNPRWEIQTPIWLLLLNGQRQEGCSQGRRFGGLWESDHFIHKSRADCNNCREVDVWRFCAFSDVLMGLSFLPANAFPFPVRPSEIGLRAQKIAPLLSGFASVREREWVHAHAPTEWLQCVASCRLMPSSIKLASRTSGTLSAARNTMKLEQFMICCKSFFVYTQYHLIWDTL